MTRTYVFEAPDGSQVLVTLYEIESFDLTGGIEVAQRADQYGSWGPPFKFVSEEKSP